MLVQFCLTREQISAVFRNAEMLQEAVGGGGRTVVFPRLRATSRKENLDLPSIPAFCGHKTAHREFVFVKIAL